MLLSRPMLWVAFFCLLILAASFLVGLSQNKLKNLTLESWNSIWKPFLVGGLGFSLMWEVNRALVSKLGWKLLTNQSHLWAAHLKSKYLSKWDFFSSQPPQIAPGFGRLNPWLLRGLATNFTTSSLPIWSSHWIPSIPYFKPNPINSSNLTYPNLIILDLICPSNSWNAPLISSLFDQLSAKGILSMRLPINPTSDKLIWTHSSSRDFTSSTLEKHLEYASNQGTHFFSSFQFLFWPLVPPLQNRWLLYGPSLF